MPQRDNPRYNSMFATALKSVCGLLLPVLDHHSTNLSNKTANHAVDILSFFSKVPFPKKLPQLGSELGSTPVGTVWGSTLCVRCAQSNPPSPLRKHVTQ